MARVPTRAFYGMARGTRATWVTSRSTKHISYLQ